MPSESEEFQNRFTMNGNFEWVEKETCEVCNARFANGVYDLDGVETLGCGYCFFQKRETFPGSGDFVWTLYEGE